MCVSQAAGGGNVHGKINFCCRMGFLFEKSGGCYSSTILGLHLEKFPRVFGDMLKRIHAEYATQRNAITNCEFEVCSKTYQLYATSSSTFPAVCKHYYASSLHVYQNLHCVVLRTLVYSV